MNRCLSSLWTCAAVILITALVPSDILAAAVQYDESVDGDLAVTFPRSNFPLLGDLDAGINTIKGHAERPTQGAADEDSFRVALPSGLQIDSVEVTITDFTAGQSNAGGEVDYHAVSDTTIYTHLFSSDGTDALINIFPTNVPTDYTFHIFPTFVAAFDWEIRISVSIATLDEKVCICHIPPGNPNNARTICIDTHAVPAHLGHGDTIGPCGGI